MNWWQTPKCDRCVTDKSECVNCRDNPIYKDVPATSKFQYYIPVCPRGYTDCVYDPAYIKYNHEDWYHKLYGDLTPEEAIHVKNGCATRAIEDPNEKYYCYDDEDK